MRLYKSCSNAVKVISLIFIICGIIFISLFIPATFIRVWNTGTYFGYAIGIVTVALGLLMPVALNHGKRAARYIYRGGLVVYAVLGIYALTLSGLMLFSMNNAPEEKHDRTMIVLGCQVKQSDPSLMLTKRLERAYSYLSQNEDVLCIVSGGQGNDEHMSEAQVMYDWLTEKGIEKERIIKEDRSTSTLENLKFSGEILKNNGRDKDVILVTDGFHQYRASLQAASLGYDIRNLSSDTPWFLLPSYWVREWFALSYEFVFG